MASTFNQLNETIMVAQLINDLGKPARNQYVIVNNNGTFFQSYSTVIAVIDDRKNLTLSDAWDASTTTSKHLYIFLRQNGLERYAKKNAILKGIKDGKIGRVHTLSTDDFIL